MHFWEGIRSTITYSPPVFVNSCLPTHRGHEIQQRVNSLCLWSQPVHQYCFLLIYLHWIFWRLNPEPLRPRYPPILPIFTDYMGLTLFSKLDPIHSHASLYSVVGTAWLPRLPTLVTSTLSNPFCFLWPNVSVPLVLLLVIMAKSIMSIYRQHQLGINVLECGLKCALQGQA